MSITGSNNPFACEPVVFANANSIVSLGTITRDGNQFTFSVGFVWKINGVTYQNTAPVVLTIAEASEGFQRIDNALLNTSNTIELQQGNESDTIALKPIAPDTNIILTSWNISGTTIGDTEDPIIGTSFVKKSFFAPFVSTVTGADAIIPLDPNGYSEIRLTDASLTSIAGFDLSLITGVPTAEVPYNGKPYIIRNLTGNNITIKNELSAADFPFYLSGGADLVFPNGQAIYLLYDASGFIEIFKSWSTLDETTDFGNTTTNDITTGKITTPMVKLPKGSYNVDLYPVDLTANRKLEAPNKNGIIATLDDIPSNPITGTGANGQVSFFNGTNSQTGDNGLFWDNRNKRLGVGSSATPQARLDVRAQGALSTDIALRVRNSADTGDLFLVKGDGADKVVVMPSAIIGQIEIVGLNIGAGGGNVISSGNRWIFGGFTANASAQLQVDSTTRGFLPPRMTTTQRDAIATPAAGLVIYNTTTNTLDRFNGTSWNAFESVDNKVTDLNTPNNTSYPTTQAVVNENKKATITVELIDLLTTNFYAPNALRINSTALISGSGTITLKVNDVAYTLGNLITQGQKITVETTTASVYNLISIYE